jgi:hypothetical protein
MADKPTITIPFMVIRDKCGICGGVVKAEDSLPLAQRLQRAHRVSLVEGHISYS